MDQRIINVLKAIAFEYIEHDQDGYHCIFCGGEEIPEPLADKIDHDKSDCQTAQARAILRDLTMPLCLYKVSYELCRDHVWQSRTQFFPAFSKKAVNDAFRLTKLRRDVRIERVREL